MQKRELWEVQFLTMLTVERCSTLHPTVHRRNSSCPIYLAAQLVLEHPVWLPLTCASAGGAEMAGIWPVFPLSTWCLIIQQFILSFLTQGLYPNMWNENCQAFKGLALELIKNPVAKIYHLKQFTRPIKTQGVGETAISYLKEMQYILVMISNLSLLILWTQLFTFLPHGKYVHSIFKTPKVSSNYNIWLEVQDLFFCISSRDIYIFIYMRLLGYRSS